MGILTGLLQGLSGVIGGINGTVGIQILGSGTIDMGSMNPVSVLYTPPVLNNAHLVALTAVVRLPNGTAEPTPSGFPLQISIRFNGTQGFVVPVDGQGMAAASSKYVFAQPAGPVPLGADTTMTAQMVVASAASKNGIVDVIGYGVSQT